MVTVYIFPRFLQCLDKDLYIRVYIVLYKSLVWNKTKLTCNQPRSNTPDDALHFLSLESPWQRQSTSLMPNIENWLKWQISTRSALKTTRVHFRVRNYRMSWSLECRAWRNFAFLTSLSVGCGRSVVLSGTRFPPPTPRKCY
jgi:hypothetical protein